MPWLVQYGPRSLNFINKKQDEVKINQENQLLRDKIEKARSSVCRGELAKHQEMVSERIRYTIKHS